MSHPSFYPGLAALADRYDAFIVDLWGVMHDGIAAFPDAVAALKALKAAGKRSVILSNAPRRVDVIVARNAELGIDPKLPDALMSSGEDAWQHLSQRRDPWYRALGRRCYHLGPERDHGMREGLDLDFVESLEQADFILNTGNLSPLDSVETYDDFIGQALGLGLPMICTNPDLVVVRGGKREICAGAIALAFEQRGGEVRWHGKPHPEVYLTCFDLLPGIAPERIAAIGDSLRTDVAGAAAAGIDCIFVAAGIHGEELGVDKEGIIDPDRYAAMIADAPAAPSAVMPFMRW